MLHTKCRICCSEFFLQHQCNSTQQTNNRAFNLPLEDGIAESCKHKCLREVKSELGPRLAEAISSSSSAFCFETPVQSSHLDLCYSFDIPVQLCSRVMSSRTLDLYEQPLRLLKTAIFTLRPFLNAILILQSFRSYNTLS